MNHQGHIVCELKPDDLEQIPSRVGSDGENLGRIGIRLEVDDGEGMVEGVEDGRLVDAVPVG